MKIRAVLFDVYGTLVELPRPSAPYRQLIRKARINPKFGAREVMCRSINLAEAVELFDVQMPKAELATLEQHLHEELAGARLYPEVRTVLATLRKRRYRIGLCSNLAQPYVAPVVRLIGSAVDSATWSCVAGAMKPSPLMYSLAAKSLKVDLESILMVGDSYIADVAGPREAGCRALHLGRTGGGDITTLSELLDRLPPLS